MMGGGEDVAGEVGSKPGLGPASKIGGFEIKGGLRVKDLSKKGVDVCGMQWVKMGNRGELCLFMVNKDIGR